MEEQNTINCCISGLNERKKKQKHNLTNRFTNAISLLLLAKLHFLKGCFPRLVCYSELMNRNCFLWIEGNDTSSVEIGMILKKVSYLSLVQCRGHSV